MGSCAQSAHDFITNAFPAIVGTLASEDAEYVCQKNDLSFVELIRPFCQLDSEAQIHDPVNPNIVIQVKKMKIRLVDIQSSLPPQALMTRVLTEVVSKTVSLPDLNSALSVPDQIASATPWYEAYRDCFFQLIPPMNHEFIRDILACILVVSTKHADPMHAFAALSSRQNSIQHASDKPKTAFNWFSPNTFKYYLLLHDASEGEDGKAEAVYQNMKSVYGSHMCFLLQINSRQKMYPQANQMKMNFSDPWSQHIYPFSDETFDIDESELEKDAQVSVPLSNQKDADQKEEAIINELENIDRQIEQNPQGTQPVTFNDPLTSMHYNDMLDNDTEDLGPLSPKKVSETENAFRPRKLSERTIKLQEYKRTLRQLSYSMVSGSALNTRRERGHCMTLVDQDKIKAFVYEFTVRGLLPYIEKVMRTLSEQILARRGLHKSIFHATKKWFGSNKASGGGVGYGFSTGSSYTSESSELQYRKIGDLSFLVQHYDLAYNSYHSAKREFNNDHAWMYFAGALEMAAISAFMQGNFRNYPLHYFDACISTYLNTCRMVDYATRACLMSTEALLSRGLFREAAVEFIKLTNEDSDLRSALLLEQAAHCYVHDKPPMIRKYAFHMILAGHRYSKAAQRKHTLRCYISALQVYGQKGWHLAEDHVNFIIGRQSFNLGKLNDSQLALKSLLLYQSEQQPSQQASYLREFLAVFKQNLESVRNKSQTSSEKLSLPDVPLPKIRDSLTRCLLYVRNQPQTPAPTAPSTPSQRRTRTVNAGNYSFQRNYSKSYIKRWSALEKRVVTVAKGHAPYPFKPFCPCLSSDTDNQANPIVAVDEAFAYEIQFVNPLKIPLNLLNLSLLWEFVPHEDPDSLLTNTETDHSESIWAEKVANFQLSPSESKPVHLKLTAKVAGKLKVRGLKYTLSSVAVTSSVDEYGKVELSTFQEAALNTVGVLGMQELQIKGPRMNATKQEKAGIVYGIDRRMEPHILPALPLLEIKMVDLPMTLLCGEVQKSVFTFKNIGRIPLKNLHVICSRPQFFSYGQPIYKNDSESDRLNSSNRIFNLETADTGNLYMKMNNIETLRNNDVVKIPLVDNRLACDSEISLPVYVYGSDISSVHEINFVFYYEPLEDIKGVPYRLIQQMIRIQTLSSLTVSVSTRYSTRGPVTETLPSNGLQNSNDQVANEELLISLTIENQAQGALNLRCVEFSLKHLTCYSCSWSVESLVNLSQDTYRLRPGENCSLHLKSRSIEKKQNDVAHICDIPLGDDKKDACPGEESLDLFMKPGENIDAVLSSLGLILYWETFFIDEGFTRIVICGQSHVTVKNSATLQKNLSPLNAPPPSITRGINISYDYPPIVYHDFLQRSLCVVEINVKCSNVTDRNVIIEIEAVDLHEDSEVAVDKHSLNLIQWVGRRQISIDVPSRTTKSLVMHALFACVGVYEIQNLNAYVDNQPEGGILEKVSLNLPSSHLLCIENSTADNT